MNFPLAIGSQIGLWTIIGLSPRKQYKRTYWRCRCACGKVQDIVDSYLRKGAKGCRNCANRKWHTAEGKQCSRCSAIKSAAEFGKASYAWDGLYAQCRACTRETSRIAAAKKPKPESRPKVLDVLPEGHKRCCRAQCRVVLCAIPANTVGSFPSSDEPFVGGRGSVIPPSLRLEDVVKKPNGGAPYQNGLIKT